MPMLNVIQMVQDRLRRLNIIPCILWLNARMRTVVRTLTHISRRRPYSFGIAASTAGKKTAVYSSSRSLTSRRNISINATRRSPLARYPSRFPEFQHSRTPKRFSSLPERSLIGRSALSAKPANSSISAIRYSTRFFGRLKKNRIRKRRISRAVICS